MADLRTLQEIDSWVENLRKQGHRVDKSRGTVKGKDKTGLKEVEIPTVIYTVNGGPYNGQTVEFYETGNQVDVDDGDDNAVTSKKSPEIDVITDTSPSATTKKADHGAERKRYYGEDPYGSGKKGTIIEYSDDYKQFIEDTKASDPFAGYTLQPGPGGPSGTKVYSAPGKPDIKTNLPNSSTGPQKTTVNAPDGSVWQIDADGTKTKLFDKKPEPNKVTIIQGPKGKLAVKTDNDGNILDSKLVPGTEEEEKPLMLTGEDGKQRPHRAIRDSDGNITAYEEIQVKETGPKVDLTNEPDPSFQVGRVVEDLRAYQKWLAGEYSAGRMTKAQADGLFNQRAKLAETWTNEQKSLRDEALTERSQTISRQNSIATTVGAVNNNAIETALKINSSLQPGSTGGFDVLMGTMFMQLMTLQATGALDMPDEIIGKAGRDEIKRSFGVAVGGKKDKETKTVGKAHGKGIDAELGGEEKKPETPEGNKPAGETHNWTVRLTPEQQKTYAEWLAQGGDGTYKSFSDHLNKMGFTISAPPDDPETPAAVQKATAEAAQPTSMNPEELNVLKHSQAIWDESVSGFADTLRKQGYDISDGQAAQVFYMTPTGRGMAQSYIEQAAKAMGMNFNADTQPTLVDAIADAWTKVQAKIDEGDTRHPVQIALDFAKTDGRLKQLIPAANKEMEAPTPSQGTPVPGTSDTTLDNSAAGWSSKTPAIDDEAGLPASLRGMGLEGTPGGAQSASDAIPGLPSSMQGLGSTDAGDENSMPAPSAMMIGEVTDSLSNAMKRYGLPWNDDLASNTVNKYLDTGFDPSSFGSSLTMSTSDEEEEDPIYA